MPFILVYFVAGFFHVNRQTYGQQKITGNAAIAGS
jgi:hypothetical protein